MVPALRDRRDRVLLAWDRRLANSPQDGTSRVSDPPKGYPLSMLYILLLLRALLLPTSSTIVSPSLAVQASGANNNANSSPEAVNDRPLHRQLMGEFETIGDISDIVLWRITDSDDEQVILAGTQGALVLDPISLETKEVVEFAAALPPNHDANTRCRIVDADGDGRPEFIRMAEAWAGRTSLHMQDGGVIWTYPAESTSSSAIDGTKICDVGNDNKLEFLIITQTGRELVLLDHRGQLLWSKTNDHKIKTDTITFTDINGDGEDEILYADGRAIRARGAVTGDLVRTEVPSKDCDYVNHLELLRSLGSPPRDRLLGGCYMPASDSENEGQKWYLLAFEPEAASTPVAWSEIENHREFVSVDFPELPHLRGGRVEMISTQADYGGLDRTELRVTIIDKRYTRVFEDLLSAKDGSVIMFGALACIPVRGANRLLVGYGSSLWAYSPSS